MLLNLTEFSSDPVHIQIARQILERIVCGELATGEFLPSFRRLARDHHLSVETVRRAYRELKSLGVIAVSQEGGKTICRVAPPLPAERIGEIFQGLDASEAGRFSPAKSEAARYRRLEGELKKAGQIQRALLPRSLSFRSDLQLAGFCLPSLVVGGDFFDVLPLDEDRLAVVVADACGKGMPAALLVAQIQAILKVEALRGSSISGMMAVLNDYLYEFTSSANFATLFYAQFDFDSGRLCYVNAGHNPAILQRAGGGLDLLDATRLPLGIFAGVEHSVPSCAMGDGDCLMVYSDGMTEARSPQGEEFGVERLTRLLSDNRSKRAREIVELIGERLKSFHRAGWWQDDRTLLVMKRPSPVRTDRPKGCADRPEPTEMSLLNSA